MSLSLLELFDYSMPWCEPPRRSIPDVQAPPAPGAPTPGQARAMATVDEHPATAALPWRASQGVCVGIDTGGSTFGSGRARWFVTCPSHRLRVRLGLVFVPDVPGVFPTADPPIMLNTIAVTPQTFVKSISDFVDVQPFAVVTEHWTPATGYTLEMDTAADRFRIDATFEGNSDAEVSTPGTYHAIASWEPGPGVTMSAAELAELRPRAALQAPTAISIDAGAP